MRIAHISIHMARREGYFKSTSIPRALSQIARQFSITIFTIFTQPKQIKGPSPPHELPK